MAGPSSAALSPLMNLANAAAARTPLTIKKRLGIYTCCCDNAACRRHIQGVEHCGGKSCGGLADRADVCVCGTGWKIKPQVVHAWRAVLLAEPPPLGTHISTCAQWVHACHFDSKYIVFGPSGSRARLAAGDATPSRTLPVDIAAMKRRAAERPASESIYRHGTNARGGLVLHDISELSKAEIIESCDAQLRAVERQNDELRSQLAECEQHLIDFAARIDTLERDLSRARHDGLAKSIALTLKQQQLERLLAAHERSADTFVSAAASSKRMRGMSMKKLLDPTLFANTRVRTLTNFGSAEELNLFYHQVVNGDGAADRIALHNKEEGAQTQRKRAATIPREDCFLFCLMWLKMGVNQDALAAWFDWSVTFASATIHKFMPFLRECLQSLAWVPQRPYVQQTLTHPYKEAYGLNIVELLDGTEGRIETPSDPDVRKACWSSYKHDYTW